MYPTFLFLSPMEMTHAKKKHYLKTSCFKITASRWLFCIKHFEKNLTGEFLKLGGSNARKRCQIITIEELRDKISQFWSFKSRDWLRIFAYYQENQGAKKK